MGLLKKKNVSIFTNKLLSIKNPIKIISVKILGHMAKKQLCLFKYLDH